MNNAIFQKLLRVGLFFALFSLGAASVLAWTGPLVGPPSCTSGNPGCDQPINQSTNTQTKGGPFNISMPSGSNTWGIEVQGGNNGIAGIGGTSYGLYGQSTSGVGVAAYSGSGSAIYANSTSNWGATVGGGGGGLYSATSNAAAWAGEFINSGASGQGLYAQNPSAYAEIAYSGYGLYTNGNIYTTKDIYDGTSGKWLSTGGAAGLPFGGGFAQYPGGGCPDPNYAGGSGCGCPAYAPSAVGIGSGTCSASACNIYVCY